MKVMKGYSTSSNAGRTVGPSKARAKNLDAALNKGFAEPKPVSGNPYRTTSNGRTGAGDSGDN